MTSKKKKQKQQAYKREQMGNQAVKSHMQNAERTGVFSLTKAGVAEFPKDVAQLKATCRSIDLSGNKIKVIPPELGSFAQLKVLNLSGNKIGPLPEELGGLQRLETLNLNSNHIMSIPSSFGALNALRNLNLSENKLTAFPVVLAQCKLLDVLDLSKDKITELPAGIENLQCSELILNQNQISTISDAVASCPRLKVLRLEENCLNVQAIPSKLLSDSQVNLLAIDGNLFEMKDLQSVSGYDKYQERFTATKKKMF